MRREERNRQADRAILDLKELAHCIQTSGYRKQELAAQLGIDRGTFRHYLTGSSPMPTRVRTQLFKLLGYSPSDFTSHPHALSKEVEYRRPDSCHFSFGRIQTPWIVVEGDGTAEYLPHNIRTHFDPLPETLPADLQARRCQIQQQQEQQHNAGYPYQWNGDRYSLNRYVTSRDPLSEEMILDLWFKPSDYYTFLATNMSLEDTQVRGRYLHDIDWHSPVHYFSNSFGISLVVLTSDGYTMLTQRGKHLGSRSGNYNVAISEGLSRPLDRSTKGLAPDIYRCACRGLAEELGVVEPEDYAQLDIIFLSFGVDTFYSLWGLRGLVKTYKTAEDLLRHRTNGVKDKGENQQMFPVLFTPEHILPFVLSKEPWAPSALVCLYHALVHEFGHARVDDVLNY